MWWIGWKINLIKVFSKKMPDTSKFSETYEFSKNGSSIKKSSNWKTSRNVLDLGKEKNDKK